MARHIPTDCQLRHAIAAMRQHLDPSLAHTMTVSELEGLTAHCTRAELLAMVSELEARVRLKGEEWQRQRARAGRAA